MVKGDHYYFPSLSSYATAIAAIPTGIVKVNTVIVMMYGAKMAVAQELIKKQNAEPADILEVITA